MVPISEAPPKKKGRPPKCDITVSENNDDGTKLYFDGKPWKELSKEEIAEKGQQLKRMTGTSNPRSANALFYSHLKALPPQDTTSFPSKDGGIHLLNELQPQDAVEAMLCSQLITLHFKAMEAVSRANYAHPGEPETYYTNSAAKWMRLHHETLMTLEKYRRKIQQTIIVQHVNVQDGGKAIVGNVQAEV